MENNFQSVFGFTIGPIYEMMSHSQKTRELWFSSFFFSWYVKKFYDELSGTKGVEILSPHFYPTKPPGKSKAGLFPDHIVGGINQDSVQCMKLLKDKNIIISNFFIEEIVKLGSYLVGKKGIIETIFKDYLQTSFVVLSAEGLVRKKIVETVDVHLDALERNRSFSLGKNEDTCYRCKTLPSVFKITDKYDKKIKEQKVCPFCFFKFKSNESDNVCTETGQSKQFRYRSTGEISADELIRGLDKSKLKKYLDDYDEISFDFNTQEGKAFSDLINGKKVEDYHKYMAIVVADGDSLGKIANNVDDPQKFSDTLFEFGKIATNITEQFHGEPVYLGGDDLLSFMPAAFLMDDKIITVLDYIKSLSTNYSAKLTDIGQNGTISFGIHLFYYKSPLSTALKDARNLLYEAKNERGKNSVILQLTQHSGQQVKIKFNLGSSLLTNFSELLSGFISGNIKYPEGIHHNVSRYRTLLTNLNDPCQIDYFLENRFNEDIHKNQKDDLQKLFDLLKEMLTYKTNGSSHIINGELDVSALDEFLSQLRFIKFLAGDK